MTTEPWAVPAGFHSSDSDAVPPSAEETAASAAYRARKRCHAEVACGLTAQPGTHACGSQAFAPSGTAAGVVAVPASGAPAGAPGSRGAEEGKEKARAVDPGGLSVGLCVFAPSNRASSADCGPRTPPRDRWASVARDRGWDTSWRDHHSSAASDGYGGGCTPQPGSGVASY